jgi:hypothetical protein
VPSTLTIDIELTNNCNAACSFCPRDATPHEGLMRPEVFERSFAAITAEKLARVGSRKPLCKRCTLDPINLVARRRHVADPTASRPFDATIEDILDNDRAARRLAAEVIAAARR